MDGQKKRRRADHHIGCSTRDEQWLLETVQSLAEEAAIGMPEVGIFPSDAANAFATGWNRNNALVAVSSGLLRRFEQSEARAVLAHEIGHVANGDMITLTLLQGVVNTFVMFFARIIGHTVDRVDFQNATGVTVSAISLSPLWRKLFWASSPAPSSCGSRALESIELMKLAPSWRAVTHMIAALQRLKAEQGLPQDLPGEMTAFGIRSAKGSQV